MMPDDRQWRAGATDLEDRRRRGISDGPVRDVPVTPARTSMERTPDRGLRVGSLVRVQTLATDAFIRSKYRGLAAAASGLATPQIRAVATFGGALLQRSRCWYYRQPAFDCYKKGGDACPARDGDHRFGVLIDVGPCVWPHPSTLGVALLAYDARIETDRGRVLTVRDLFGDGRDPTRDHFLEPEELLESVALPPPVDGERAAYLRGIARRAAEWPLVEVIVRFSVDAGRIARIVVAAGAVENVPTRVTPAETALRGCSIDDVGSALETMSLDGAMMPATSYKLPILRACIADVVRLAMQEPAWVDTGAALDWTIQV